MPLFALLLLFLLVARKAAAFCCGLDLLSLAFLYGDVYRLSL